MMTVFKLLQVEFMMITKLRYNALTITEHQIFQPAFLSCSEQIEPRGTRHDEDRPCPDS